MNKVEDILNVVEKQQISEEGALTQEEKKLADALGKEAPKEFSLKKETDASEKKEEPQVKAKLGAQKIVRFIPELKQGKVQGKGLIQDVAQLANYVKKPDVEAEELAEVEGLVKLDLPQVKEVKAVVNPQVVIKPGLKKHVDENPQKVVKAIESKKGSVELKEAEKRDMKSPQVELKKPCVVLEGEKEQLSALEQKGVERKGGEKVLTVKEEKVVRSEVVVKDKLEGKKIESPDKVELRKDQGYGVFKKAERVSVNNVKQEAVKLSSYEGVGVLEKQNLKKVGAVEEAKPGIQIEDFKVPEKKQVPQLDVKGLKQVLRKANQVVEKVSLDESKKNELESVETKKEDIVHNTVNKKSEKTGKVNLVKEADKGEVEYVVKRGEPMLLSEKDVAKNEVRLRVEGDDLKVDDIEPKARQVVEVKEAVGLSEVGIREDVFIEELKGEGVDQDVSLGVMAKEISVEQEVVERKLLPKSGKHAQRSHYGLRQSIHNAGMLGVKAAVKPLQVAGASSLEDNIRISAGLGEQVTYYKEVARNSQTGMTYASKQFTMINAPEIAQKMTTTKLEGGALSEAVISRGGNGSTVIGHSNISGQQQQVNNYTQTQSSGYSGQQERRQQGREQQSQREQRPEQGVEALKTLAKGVQRVSASTFESLDLGSNSQISATILNQIRQFRESGRSWMRVPLNLPDGKSVSMHLNTSLDRIQVKFSGDTEGFKDEVSDDWEQLKVNAQNQGIMLEDLIFTEKDI